MANEASAIETAAAALTLRADDVAGRFEVASTKPGRNEADIAQILADLKFGTVFTDHMVHMTWRLQGGWGERRLEDYGDLSLSPAASVLHYGQEIFEGLKAYRHADGSLWTFRPGFNAVRMNASARRMAMPQLEVEDFLGSIVDLVCADAAYVPELPGALYLRPFMFASEAFLGVRPSHRFEYLLIASPVGAYFANGFTPVSIWVSRTYHRAGPGGTGAAKTAGNYASSLLPQQEAAAKGFEQVCFLDARDEVNLEELGGMNVFVVYSDGRVATPRLTGSILEGGTRSAIIQLLADDGITVEQTAIPLSELIADIESGAVSEVFACGTAAVVTPIGRLASDDFDVSVPSGAVTASIHERLTAIQAGEAEDTHGWMFRIS